MLNHHPEDDVYTSGNTNNRHLLSNILHYAVLAEERQGQSMAIFLLREEDRESPVAFTNNTTIAPSQLHRSIRIPATVVTSHCREKATRS